MTDIATCLDEFQLMAEGLPRPLIIYRLIDHAIVYANRFGQKVLNDTMQSHEGEFVGDIFYSELDLRRIESQLLIKDFCSARDVKLHTQDGRCMRKNIFARSTLYEDCQAVTLIFSDSDTSSYAYQI